MLAYLILAGHAGQPIPPELVTRFSHELPAGVPFVPDEHIVWSNASGNVVFLGWQAFTELAGIRSHWAIDERGLTAFAGHGWPRATGWNHQSGQSWATQLAAYLARHPLPGSIEEFYGQHTLISLSSQGDGIVTPDFASIDPLFLATDDTVTAISNRSGLCAYAITPSGNEPERSLTGAGWVICHTEVFFDGETGYWDVERIPLGAHVQLSPDRGATMVECERCPLGPMGATATYEELLDEVEFDLRVSLRAIAELPLADRELSLSGGIDSRILTAAIISEGLQDRFHFITIGPPERSDVIVAVEITRRYGLRWSTIDLTERALTEEQTELLNHVSLSEGLMNGWNTVGELTFSGGARITGLAGEFLRWGKTSRAGMAVRTEDELLALMRRNIKFDLLGIMRPEVLEYYHLSVADWVRYQLGRGETLQQVPSYFNQIGQSRHRFSVVNAWNERLTITPYFTPVFIRANQKLPVDRRPDPRFQFDLMHRFEPGLVSMPFAAQGWSADAVAHRPDAAELLAIAPVRSQGAAGGTWRVQRYADYLPMLRETLLDRGNPIHELIDADKLERVLPTGDRHDGRTRRIWAVLTAALWMGRQEHAARIGRA